MISIQDNRLAAGASSQAGGWGFSWDAVVGFVAASWVVGTAGIVGFGFHLRSREPRVAGEIGGALFAGLLSGPLAVRVLQIASIAVPVLLLLASTLAGAR